MRRLSLTVLVLAVSGAACSGGDGGGGSSGPTGDHHHYVADSIFLPASAMDGEATGADLDGDGTADNRFAEIRATLEMAFALDLQTQADEAVLRGQTLVLVDVQATDLADASDAALSTYPGADPIPAPCTIQTDLATCGQHLDGNGSFSIATGADATAMVEGDVDGGAFDGADGRLFASFRLHGEAVDLALTHAHATAALSGPIITSGKLAGAADPAAFSDAFLPPLQSLVSDIVVRDCVNPTAPPGCGCAASTTGESLISSFDGDASCTITLSELETSSMLSALLAPDVDADDDGTAESLSVGLGFSAVGATYTQP